MTGSRALALACVCIGLWLGCSPAQVPTIRVPLTVSSGDTHVVVDLEPFALHTGSGATTRKDGCAPLFVDMRVAGDSGGFAKPEAPPDNLVRYRSRDAVVRQTDPLTLDVRVAPDGGGDERHAEVVLREDADGFVAIDVRLGVTDFDVGLVGACYALSDGEHVVGGGERFDAVDLRGRVVPLYFAAPRATTSGTNEAHAPVPFFASTSGLAALVETERVGAFDVGATHPEALELRFAGTSLPLRVRSGSILDNAAAHARRMGLPPPPPRFALAPMQWRNSLDPLLSEGAVVTSGTELLLSDVEQMRALGFPASTVWIDAPWQTGYNTFQVNDVQLPRFDDAMDTLRRRGLRAIVWATEHINSSNDEEQMVGMPAYATRELKRRFDDNGWLVKDSSGDPFEFPWGRGTGAFVDFSNPAACDAFIALMNPLLHRGVVGFKLDYGESMRPDLIGIENDVARFFDGSTPRVMHTRYATLYHQCYLRALRAAHPDDAFIITRTGGIFDQHNGTTIWPGDLDASFIPAGVDTDDGLSVGGLPAAVAGYLSLAMSAYPLYGSDVGGYRGDAPTPELLARWAQFGAVSTIMQVGGGANFAPWDDAYQEVLPHVVAAARLHMNLWPMWEAWLAQASSDGTPVAVPVGVLAGDHPAAWADSATFVLGGVLLAAPVVQQGASERTLFVPPGRWVAFDGEDLGDEVIEGPGLVTVDAPLSRLPLFAAEGAVLVLGDPRLQTLLPTDDASDGGFNFFGDTHTLDVAAP